MTAVLETSPTTRSRQLPCGRLWCFRVASIACGLSVFLVVEFVCWAFDWGRPDRSEDPFVGFHAIHPLFVIDDRGETNPPGQRYHIPKSRQRFFAPDSFPVVKPPGTFRVFCFGGSTVHGEPYSKETSFTTWLRLGVEAADPSRPWEVINCGGISYASYRLVPILQECLHYQPDLFVICTGHNEFLEDRTYAQIKATPAAIAQLQRTLAQSRSYTLFRSALLSVVPGDYHTRPAAHPILPAEVDAVLDHQRGLAAYHRDDAWRDNVVAHFRSNLRRMIDLARDNGVPVLLVLPPSNLSDSPPFKCEHRNGITQPELSQWESLIEQTRDQYRSDVTRAMAMLEQALEIDDRYALTHYELGKCFESVYQLERARAAFVRARDEDICPLRIITPLEQAIRDAAAQTGTKLIDAHRLLEAQCPGEALGDYLLVDHIHPSFRGHQLIANALAEAMAEQGWVCLPTDWAARRDAAYANHFASLDPMYFLRGQRTLERLQGWAAGRAKGPPLPSRGRASDRTPIP